VLGTAPPARLEIILLSRVLFPTATPERPVFRLSALSAGASLIPIRQRSLALQTIVTRIANKDIIEPLVGTARRSRPGLTVFACPTEHLAYLSCQMTVKGDPRCRRPHNNDRWPLGRIRAPPTLWVQVILCRASYDPSGRKSVGPAPTSSTVTQPASGHRQRRARTAGSLNLWQPPTGPACLP